MAFNGSNEGYLPPHHYDQVFTAHGVIMIFFMAMPFVTGLMNFAVPLQIGARDVAFPFLTQLFSFWMTVSGCRHDHDVALRRRIRADRLARHGATFRGLATAPASASITISGPCRSLVSAPCLSGRQSDCDHRQDARTRHVAS